MRRVLVAVVVALLLGLALWLASGRLGICAYVCGSGVCPPCDPTPPIIWAR